MRLFAAAVLLLTLALLLWAWRSSSVAVAAPNPDGREPPVGAVHDVVAPEAAVPARPIERQISEAHETILEVVDNRGAALSAAGVWTASTTRSAYRRDGPGFVGSTDQNGRLAIDAALNLVVGKQGYLPRSVDITLGEHHRVELQGSPRLEVLCIEEGTRRPVADVELIAAPFALPDDWFSHFDTYVGEVSPPDTSLAVLAARSSPEGVLRLEGLPACVPRWHVRRQGFGIVDGPGMRPPDNTRLAIPGCYTLVLAPLVACGFRVIGDELIGSRFGFTNARLGGLAEWEAAQVRSALRKKFPGAAIFVAAHGPQTGPTTVNLTLQLASKGEHEASFDLMPLADFEARGPVEFNATPLPAGERSGAVSVVIHVVNGDGLPLLERKLMLSPDGIGIQPATSSKPFLAAPGMYRITALEPTINHSLPRGCEIEVASRPSPSTATPQEFTIQMTRTLFWVEFQRKDRDTVRDSVKLTHANGGTLSLSFAGKDSVEAWLPAGEITARFQSALGENRTSTLTVERSANPQIFRLPKDG